MLGLFILDISIKAILICLLLQGCVSQDCKPYEDSEIPNDCDQLNITHGNVCYKQRRLWSWTATITCHSGFSLAGSNTQTCNWSFSWTWSWTTHQSKCVPDALTTKSTSSIMQSNVVRTSKHTSSEVSTTISTSTITQSNIVSTSKHTSSDEQDGSGLVVYVTIPVVIVLLIVIVLFIIVYIYRRRKMSENKDKIYQNQTSVVANLAYAGTVDDSTVDSIPSDIAECSGTEYVYIRDSDTQPNDIVDSEYNTIHTNTNENISSNYNHAPIHHDDQYDHASNISENIQREAETYSHMNDANNLINKSGMNNETGNVYNKIEGQRLEMNEHDADPSYDHTNVRPCEPARIEIDAYADVDNRLDVKHEDSLECLEDHEYFVLETK